MSDVTNDDADTEEALAEFDFLMSEGKPMRPGASATQGKLLIISLVQASYELSLISTNRLCFTVKMEVLASRLVR